MPQDRKAITCIEQIGDRRAKVPLACMEENFQHIAMELVIFRGFFDMIVAGRRDYALMTEALLVKPV